MESALADIDGEDELDGVTDQYVGPSALWIANLLNRTVRYSQGWFWTTMAVCHGGTSSGLAFRQRPDGEEIEVRCHTGNCFRGVIVTELEDLVRLPIWASYEPVKGPVKRPWWKRNPGGVAGVLALVVGAPPLTLDVELFFLNLLGLGVGWLLFRRFTSRRPAGRFRH